MKKTLLYLFLTFLSMDSLWSQCVPTCSVYNVSPVTYTTFPSGSTNVTPSFTNPFPLGVPADDGSIGPIPIGFNFDFYCNTYTDIHICSNGFITFDYQPFAWPTQYVHPTQVLPDVADPNGMIAFNMTDLDPSMGGTITYTTIGTAPNRMFIVTYSNVPCFTTPPVDLNTGQIVLFETSNIIEIHTASAKPDINQLPNGSFQGIENTTGSLYAYPPGRNGNSTWGASANNTAYQFSPYSPAAPASLTGSTLLCEGEPVNYQASFIVDASAYNWTFPSGWLGTSTISAVTAAGGSSGNLSVTATYTCGTSAATTLSVTVNPAPVVAMSATPALICSGITVTLNTSGATNYTVNPGNIVSSAATITDTPNTTTMYTLTGSNSFGCISVNNPTAIIQVNETPTVTVNSGSICIGEIFTVTPTGAPNFVITGLPFGTTSPTVAGQYTYPVTGTGTNGCVSAIVISTLDVYALPNVGTVAQRTVMCKKESVVLTASGANTYSWSNASTNASISVSPLTTTLYVVEGFDLQGCKNTQTVTLLVKPCTGINEVSAAITNVKLFPNPTNGVFEIQLNSFNDQTSVEVYNALGQLIIKESAVAETTFINLKEFSNGLYYVKIKNGAVEQSQLIKVIKQ